VDSDLRTLRERLAEISDLHRSMGVLFWDQKVTMPPGGHPARSEALSTLSRIAHEKFVDDEVGALLERLRPLEESLEFDSDDASLVRVTRRDWEKQHRVPTELRAEMTRAAAQGNQIWVEARANSDFASFLPALERNLELKRRYVDCFEWDDSPYTPLLDDFEPFMTTTEVAEIFDAIQPVLSELVREAPVVDSSFLELPYDKDRQREFSERILATLGFEEGSLRLDPTVHPFCTSFSTRDVRLTTRYNDTGLDSLSSTMHEAGHGLYAHGIAASLERTPLAGAPSLGLNESQSRTWENLVGRSAPFWRRFYSNAREAFPERLGDVELERFVAGINKVQPSLIRIKADEVTYGLHIMLRFELEQDIINGRVALRDLPQTWNAKMSEYLGVEVQDDANGVLQDTHWASGLIGYFPTYLLGTVMSVQIWQKALEDIPDLEDQVERGEFASLREWLEQNIHRHGRKFLPQEVLEKATGATLDAKPYLAYLRAKYVAGVAA